MTKAKTVVRKPVKSQIELRRWCIEQAGRWPVVHTGGGGGVYSGGGMYKEVDVDLIGRAEKILGWVTK